MTPDFDAARWLTLLMSFANLAFMIFVYRAGARRTALDGMARKLDKIGEQADRAVTETRQKLDEVEEERRTESGERNRELGLLHARISRVENELTHLPTKEQMHTVSLAVEKISGSVSTISAKLSAVEATAARVENFLLEHK